MGWPAAAGRRMPEAEVATTGAVAPVTATTARPRQTSRSPPSACSSTGRPGGLSTSRLARRMAPRSSAPERETPRRVRPGRPSSWTRVCRPASSTSQAAAGSAAAADAAARADTGAEAAEGSEESTRPEDLDRPGSVEGPGASAASRDGAGAAAAAAAAEPAKAAKAAAPAEPDEAGRLHTAPGASRSRKRTRNPGCTRAGSARSMSHMRQGVAPSSCQPPGLSDG